MQNFKKELDKYGRARANVALAKHSSFKIGGPAQFLVEVSDAQNLAGLLGYLSGEGVDFFVLGGGSNVLFPDDGLPGVVIKFIGQKMSRQGDEIKAESGVALAALVDFSIKESLAGFEWAAGIPGSVGGAVRGNAGAKYAFTGAEMKDSVATVTVWRDGEVIDINNKECAFGYRDSVFKHNRDVVIAAAIALKPGNKTESLLMTQKIIAERRGKQSSEPSAGSFFKNVFLEEWKRDQKELPERFLNYKKIAAGWLVEQAGLKGYRDGNAMVSATHANFIINCGGATQADVLKVVDKVQSEVYNTFGIHLEPEVQIVR